MSEIRAETPEEAEPYSDYSLKCLIHNRLIEAAEEKADELIAVTAMVEIVKGLKAINQL
ncbi:hypothetical protein GPEL0_01f1053 [Geoanaerobacter pelophilus]|uniref:Uncharacterized protein n=1 Tax=Geoanaerobacter pelophilus TaxID=60036 RepID=A0ABQ0MFQ8_9BACT|nr:hypothetical protein GPEL0_01f1053 [Geoanaerobacter pelophilus]